MPGIIFGAFGGAGRHQVAPGMVSGIRRTRLLEGLGGENVGPKGDIGAQVGRQVGLNANFWFKMIKNSTKS